MFNLFYAVQKLSPTIFLNIMTCDALRYRYGKDKMSDLDAVKQDVAQLWKNHERNAAAVKEIRTALEKMLGIADQKSNSGTVLSNQPAFGGSSFA